MIKNLPQKLLIHAGILLENLSTPHDRRARKFTGRPYVASLLTPPVFFLANYLFNHHRLPLSFLPEGQPMYFFSVILPFGILLPSLTLGWLIREADGEAHIFGATLKLRDFKMTLVTLVAGVVITIFPVGMIVLKNPALLMTGVHLAIWLFMTSLAEVLLFIGAVFHTVQWLALKWLPGRNRVLRRTAIVIIVSALVFAFSHFSYPDPWNTWEMMLMLIPVGVLISMAYALTRSLMATVVFSNIIAVAGYLMTGNTFPGSDTLGVVLNGIAIFAVIIILILVGIYDEEF